VTVYDLHCHSTASDGRLTPTELLQRAFEQGVDVLSLTDHDTVHGLVEASVAAEQCGVTLIPGIEFSSQWERRGIHVVGLNIDLKSEVLTSAVTAQLAAREVRGHLIAERLTKAGVQGALAGAQSIANGAVLGRPHFAQYLLDQGRVKSINEAFKKYLGAGKVGDVKSLWPEMEQVVGWIVAAGGIAVLAHPSKYKMTRTKLRSLVSDFAVSGGKALEVSSGLMPTGTTATLARIAADYHLHASCGSDFHFPGHKWQELGQFSPLPESCVPVWDLF
jgi:predicted metal-dependent phosphoesterase TrpH